MGVFDRQIATAMRLIAKNGQRVTWRKFTRNDNVAQPWKAAAAAPVDHTNVPICFLPYTRTNMQLLRSFGAKDDGESKAGHVLGLMAPVSFVPDTRDIVLRGSLEYTIESIDVLSPNGQIILYTIDFVL